MDSRIFSLVFCVVSICFPAVTCQNFVGMKPCPSVYSKFTESVDELLGDWHITLLILDKSEEQFEERSMCIRGRILKVNKTELVQIWNLKLPEIFHQDQTEVDFPTTIIRPGTWLVRSPLGGEFRGTVLDTDGSSYLIIMYCGWTDDVSAHMMTIAMSRSHIVTPNQRLRFLSLLIKNGYDPFRDRIISWSDC